MTSWSCTLKDSITRQTSVTCKVRSSSLDRYIGLVWVRGDTAHSELVALGYGVRCWTNHMDQRVCNCDYLRKKNKLSNRKRCLTPDPIKT